jgi:hypothetical protein
MRSTSPINELTKKWCKSRGTKMTIVKLGIWSWLGRERESSCSEILAEQTPGTGATPRCSNAS